VRPPKSGWLWVVYREFISGNMDPSLGSGFQKKPWAAEKAVHSFTLRNRSAFAITETELKLMAAAAKIGCSSIPVKG
jgi:hypothetical protein